MTEHKNSATATPHTCTQYYHHAEKNPAEKAAYLLPKKAVYLSCQKGSLPLLPKNGSLPQEEEEAEKEDEKKRKEEAEEEQK